MGCVKIVGDTET